MMNSKGFVAPPILIWIVAGLLAVVAINNVYSGGTPYEQSDLAKYHPSDASTEAPTPTPIPIANPSDLVTPIKQFYSNVSSKKYWDAWLLLSKNFQDYAQGYDNFVNGYKTTLNVVVKDIYVQDLAGNIVYVQLESKDEINRQIKSQAFSGTWQLIQEKGGWKLDSAYIIANNPEPKQIALDSTPTPTGKSSKIAEGSITHDGTRTGPIVDYFEFCAGKTISVYENERLPYTVDGKTLFITQGDINCYENLLKVASGNTGVVKQAGDAIVNQRGLPTLVAEIPTIKPIQPKESPLPLFVGKGTQYTDSLGFTHFQGDNGVTGTAYTDSLGFTHYSDSTGRTATFHTDSLGFTTGGGITSHTDSLGFTHFGGGGLSGTAHTDSLGFTHYSDNLGNSTTCHTNTIGFTTCY